MRRFRKWHKTRVRADAVQDLVAAELDQQGGWRQCPAQFRGARALFGVRWDSSRGTGDHGHGHLRQQIHQSYMVPAAGRCARCGTLWCMHTPEYRTRGQCIQACQDRRLGTVSPIGLV